MQFKMNPLKTKVIKCLAVRRLIRRFRRKSKQFAVRPIFLNRVKCGESILVRELKNDAEYHQIYFRMTKENFDELLSMIEGDIRKKNKHRCPITALERLGVTLRYLASGNSQVSLATSYRISPASVSIILRETMEAICAKLEPIVLPPPTEEIWKASEEGFARIWNFPNCVGAIDGKHVRIQAPASSGSMNFNYKGYFSVVLLAVVDPAYKFVAVDIGASGSLSDGGVLARSQLGVAVKNGSLCLPEDKTIGQHTLPHVLVGDDAFPLRKNLMKPFPGKNLTRDKRIFNLRLSRARMVVECAFGILASRWRILHSTIIGNPELIKLIVKTCVLLHNFLINKRDQVTINEQDNGGINAQSVQTQGSNNHSNEAGSIREKFSIYFNNEGKLDLLDSVI